MNGSMNVVFVHIQISMRGRLIWEGDVEKCTKTKKEMREIEKY